MSIWTVTSSAQFANIRILLYGCMFRPFNNSNALFIFTSEISLPPDKLGPCRYERMKCISHLVLESFVTGSPIPPDSMGRLSPQEVKIVNDDQRIVEKYGKQMMTACTGIPFERFQTSLEVHSVTTHNNPVAWLIDRSHVSERVGRCWSFITWCRILSTHGTPCNTRSATRSLYLAIWGWIIGS